MCCHCYHPLYWNHHEQGVSTGGGSTFFYGVKKCCHHHFPSIFYSQTDKKRGLYFGYTFLLAQHIHRMRMLSFFVQSLLLIPSLQLVGRRSARHPQPFRIGQTCNGTVFFQISLQQRPTLLLLRFFTVGKKPNSARRMSVSCRTRFTSSGTGRKFTFFILTDAARISFRSVTSREDKAREKRTQAVQPHIFFLAANGIQPYRPPPVALPPHSPPNMRYAWTTPSLCDR